MSCNLFLNIYVKVTMLTLQFEILLLSFQELSHDNINMYVHSEVWCSGTPLNLVLRKL